MKFIRKYKYILFTNLFIFLSYLRIVVVNNIFGIDEAYANTDIYDPMISIGESIMGIINRAVYWNMRLGEIIFFILSRFPSWVIAIADAFTILIFLNLIYIFVYGKNSKKYFNTFKYYNSLIVCFLVSLTLFPAFSEVMIWNAGIYNHIFSVNLSLVAALPFRLLLDDYDLFLKKKKLKYLYILIAFLAGFSVENVTAWMLVYNFIILVYKKIKLKDLKKSIKNNLFYIVNIVTTIIGFGVMYWFTRARIDLFSVMPFVQGAKKLLLLKIPYLYIFVIILISILLICCLKAKRINLKKLKNIEKILLFQVLSSLVSIIIILITPSYFAYRVTVLFFAFQLTLIVYLLNNLLKNKIEKIGYVVGILFTLVMVVRLVNFYNDFNEFNVLRDEYMREQYANGETVLSCPDYEKNDKDNYFFVGRLVSFDALFCDAAYYKYLLNDENVDVVRSYEKIR